MSTVRRRSSRLRDRSASALSQEREASPAVKNPEDTVYAKTYPSAYETDTNLVFLFKPHTLSALFGFLILLVYFAFTGGDAWFEGVDSTQKGLIAVILSFLLFSMLQFRDGPFFRPHPALWRVVQGLSIVYLMILVFLLFQTREEAHTLIKKLVDPSHGPLPERDYGSDCRIYTPENPVSSFNNLRETVFDEFMVAHALGWFGKMLMVRDYTLCWVLSIGFELVEITFAHMLHNFNECWWDQIILDVLLCNLIGMYLGKLALRWLDGKEYNWVGFKAIPTVKGKVKRSMEQFTPVSWTSFDWQVFSSFKRFFAVVLMVVGIELCELNAFFLKTVLWLKPSHPLNLIRLAIWWSGGCVALREYYQFVADKSCKKLGAQIWIATATLFTEVMIIVKFGQGMFPAPTPLHVVLLWTAIGLALTSFCLYEYVYKKWKGPKDFYERLIVEFKIVLSNFT